MPTSSSCCPHLNHIVKTILNHEEFILECDTWTQRRKAKLVGGGVGCKQVISIEAYTQSTIFGEQYT